MISYIEPVKFNDIESKCDRCWKPINNIDWYKEDFYKNKECVESKFYCNDCWTNLFIKKTNE